MIALNKTRMVLFVILFLSSVSNGAAAEKELKCPVNNPAGRSPKREATAREAGRIASSLWKDVQKQSNNKTMSSTWLQRFDACLSVSGLEFGQIVRDRSPFRHVAVRTIQAQKENLQKNAETKDVAAELRLRREQLDALRALDPEFMNGEHDYFFSEKEIAELKSRRDTANEAELKKAKVAKAEAKKNCAPVDFSARLGMVRNQTDIGWCYAFASAELVTFKLGPSNAHSNRRVSATDLAFLYNREHQRAKAQAEGVDTGEQEGGVEAKALKAALKHGGYCLEKNAPSEDFAYGLLKETITEVEGFKLEQIEREFSDDQLCYAYNRTRELFPNVKYQDFADILKVLGDRNLEYFEKLNDQNCKSFRRPYGIDEGNIRQVTSANGSNGDKVLEAINEQLDKGNISAVAFPFSMISTSDTGGHSVTLVGRRFNEKTQSCEYLLRNSWGLGCSAPLKQNLCAQEHPGHLWVGADDMKKNLWRVTYIE